MTASNAPWWERQKRHDTEWMERGACREVDPDLWFPEQGANTTNKARAVCDRCVVNSECLDYALAHPGVLGIWAGTTESQRNTIRKRRRA